MQNLFTSLYLSLFNAISGKKGQGALEYIAIVFGIVIAVAIGFQIAGENIFARASSFVQEVVGASDNSGLGG